MTFRWDHMLLPLSPLELELDVALSWHVPRLWKNKKKTSALVPTLRTRF